MIDFFWGLLVLNGVLWVIMFFMKKPIIIETDIIPRFSGDFPQGVSAFMFVLIRKGYLSQSLIDHETIHFHQFRCYSPLGAGVIYFFSSLYWFIRTGSLWRCYVNNILEREARGEITLPCRKRRNHD